MEDILINVCILLALSRKITNFNIISLKYRDAKEENINKIGSFNELDPLFLHPEITNYQYDEKNHHYMYIVTKLEEI
jgi:hypothetical protein